jgi:single-stranded DNA-binding protein
MNKSILFGRLVKDPDIRYTQTQSGSWQLPTSGLR